MLFLSFSPKRNNSSLSLSISLSLFLLRIWPPAIFQHLNEIIINSKPGIYRQQKQYSMDRSTKKRIILMQDLRIRICIKLVTVYYTAHQTCGSESGRIPYGFSKSGSIKILDSFATKLQRYIREKKIISGSVQNGTDQLK